MAQRVRVLTVAGSDPSGGAGLQGDIKTITALGAYAAGVVTALTVQDTLGVHAVSAVSAELVEAQLQAVLTDIGADAIKVSVVGSAEVIRRVTRTYDAYAREVPLILDPVLGSTSGFSLLEREAWPVLDELIGRAALVTPNVPEAEALTGCSIAGVADLDRALDAFLARGAGAVLIKGGHLPGPSVTDRLRTADGDEAYFEHPRVETTSTHGTGCALSAAIAVGVAEGLRLSDAVRRAREYVQRALLAAPAMGQGFGPLDHAFAIAAYTDTPEHGLVPEGTPDRANLRAVKAKRRTWH